MAHPLELAYNWRTPALFTSLGVVVCEGLLIRGRVPGWGSAAVLVLVLGLGFLGLVYLRTRASLMVDGSRLTVRTTRRFHTIEGDGVVRVAQFHTPNGPSYKLWVREPSGAVRRVVAPVALLRQGHATLFTWILAYAPQAELDKGSRKTLGRLRERGLVA